MKFFAIFALAAIFAVAAAIPYEYDSEYETGFEGADLEAEASEQQELIREERSYGGAKCGKAVIVSCGPVVKKVKCKGGY